MPSEVSPLTHITVTHFCHHERTYRRGSEWPAHRPCFECALQISEYVERRLRPLVPAMGKRHAIAALVHELTENIYKIAYARGLGGRPSS